MSHEPVNLQLSVEDQEELFEKAPETDTTEDAETASENPVEMESAAAERERRLTFVRDINTKIGDLENNILLLTEAFGESQEALQSSLKGLYKRSEDTAVELSSVCKQMEKSTRAHAETAKAMESRLQSSITVLHDQLGQTGSVLQLQQDRLDALESDHESLLQMQEKMSAETRQQLQVHRTHIDGLNALHREQKQSLEDLTGNLDGLNNRAGALADQLHELSAATMADRLLSNKRFRLGARVIAGVFVVSFGAQAYLHWHPVVPSSVQTQITDIKTAESREAAKQVQVESGQVALQKKMDALEAKVAQQSQNIATLYAEAERTTAALAHVQDSQSQLKKRVNTFTKSTDDSDTQNGSQVPVLHDTAWLDGLPGTHFTIQMLSGSRLESLSAYVQKHASVLQHESLAYAKKNSRGNTWYSLTYGDFSTRQEADHALAALPASMRQNKPWIRTIGSLQHFGVR